MDIMNLPEMVAWNRLLFAYVVSSIFHNQLPARKWPYYRIEIPVSAVNSRAMAKNFTSRGISAGFPRVSAGFPCRCHKGTAKSPSRKSRLICKKNPFPREFRGISRGKPNLAVLCTIVTLILILSYTSQAICILILISPVAAYRSSNALRKE